MSQQVSQVVVVGIGNMGNMFLKRVVSTAKAAAEAGVFNMEQVAFWNLNTHTPALRQFGDEWIGSVQLGKRTCRGLGTGRSCEKGRAAWLESVEEGALERLITRSVKLVIPIVGLGGGSGQGAIDDLLEHCLSEGLMVTPVIAYPHPNKVSPQNLMAAGETFEWIKSHHVSRFVIDNEAVHRDAGALAPTIFRNQVPHVAEGIVGLVRLFLDLSETYQASMDESNIGVILSSGGNLLSGGGRVALSGDGFETRLSDALDAALRNDWYYQFSGRTAASLTILRGPWMGLHEGTIAEQMAQKDGGHPEFNPMTVLYPEETGGEFFVLRTDQVVAEPAERTYRWLDDEVAPLEEESMPLPAAVRRSKPNGGAGRPLLPGEAAALSNEMAHASAHVAPADTVAGPDTVVMIRGVFNGKSEQRGVPKRYADRWNKRTILLHKQGTPEFLKAQEELYQQAEILSTVLGMQVEPPERWQRQDESAVPSQRETLSTAPSES